ncbi:MAG TPA: response regulator [bacterium]|nr:response regulator [bacterium]HPP87525.1 response regulator [bacterium]
MSGSKNNIRILIIDDDENQRLLYKEELMEENFTVIESVNGKEAIEKILMYKPDLVILDIQMPDSNGLETMNEILTYNKQMPIILHTAYSHYKDNFMSWAADAYVVKSSNLEELKKQVIKVLKNRGVL